MSKIYDQHDAAFRHVSAYVVTNAKGERVATVAFKFAKSGLRTTCYFHVLGVEMVKAFASGGGYDKCSAAARSASRKSGLPPRHGGETQAAIQERDAEFLHIREAIKDEGQSWDRDLRDAGFNVLQAV